MEVQRSRALLPPPVPGRRFHVGSADVPRAGGRRGGDEEEPPGSTAGWRICGCQEGGARRGGAPVGGWGPLGFRTWPSRWPALRFPGERGSMGGGAVPNASQKDAAGVRVNI